jgi:hypothetical protein
VVELSLTNGKVGWNATAGTLDKKELITEFQSALTDEVAKLKEQNGENKTEIHDGKRIVNSKVLNLYSFETDNPAVWRRNRPKTELTLIIDDEPVFGSLESPVNNNKITIAIEADKGEFIEEAFVLDSSFNLLENLSSKLDKVKSQEIEFNFDGCMKLFGFLKPNSFPPLQVELCKIDRQNVNIEQKRAILRSMSQEVSFIWGPPGTGKTKTLSILLSALITAGKSVLLVANTNAAVDEIFRKFMDNADNSFFIQEGKIIRLGIPNVEDERFNQLLLDRIGEKRAFEIKKRLDELQIELDLTSALAKKYEDVEKALLQNKQQREALVREHDRIEGNIQAIQKRIDAAKADKEQTDKILFDKLQLLNRAKNTNAFKRLFAGLDKNQIEAELKEIENKFRISQLELQSAQTEFKDLTDKKNSISAIIKELDQKSYHNMGGIETLDSIHQKIDNLKVEAEKKKKEKSSLQIEAQKSKESVFNSALVIGATIARACIDPKISKRKFDVLIIDEASMAALPNVFFLAGLCSSHYVISGDFRQLPPIAKSNSEVVQRWLKSDIFRQAGIVDSVEKNLVDERLVMLIEQYRMHRSICNIISEAVYCEKLKTPEYVVASKEKLAALPPFEGEALIMCDTAVAYPYISRPKDSWSRISPYSAAISTNLALRCVEDGYKKGVKINVGVITPYRAQANLISKMIADKKEENSCIEVSTVHSFQGREKECIIFDLVEGDPEKPGKLTKGTFKDSEPGRLMTVAISRAMGKLILVGNCKYIEERFEPDNAVRQLVEKIQQNGETIESDTVLNWSVVDSFKQDETSLDGLLIAGTPISLLTQSNFYNAFIQELKKAKSRVVVFSPFIIRKCVENLFEVFEDVLTKKIPIYVVTRKSEFLKENRAEVEETLEELRKIGVKVIELSEQFHHKIAVIDSSTFYYGSLNILAHSKSSDSMMVFRSKKTISHFLRIFAVNKTIKEYENMKANSKHSLIYVIGDEIIKKESVEKTCRLCNKKLELNHDVKGFCFACPDKDHRLRYEIEIDTVKNAVISLGLKCRECSSGQMILRCAREARPFLGCSEYRKSNCHSKLELQDKYY